VIEQARDTAPLKTVAHRLFTAFTDTELGIALCLVAVLVFAADRLAGVAL
jgi:hypothetical protein